MSVIPARRDVFVLIASVNQLMALALEVGAKVDTYYTTQIWNRMDQIRILPPLVLDPVTFWFKNPALYEEFWGHLGELEMNPMVTISAVDDSVIQLFYRGNRTQINLVISARRHPGF